MSYADYSHSPETLDIENLLAEAHEEERQRVEAELQEIEQELEDRDGIHDRIVDHLEGKLEWYYERLDLLYTRSLGKHGDRERLQNRIESFYDDLRTEQRAHWRDCQDLLAERRELRHELAALDDELIAHLLDPFDT